MFKSKLIISLMLGLAYMGFIYGLKELFPLNIFYVLAPVFVVTAILLQVIVWRIKERSVENGTHIS